MEKSVKRTQRTYIKLALGSVIGFVLFVFLCWGGYRFYSVVESRHLTRRAAAYLGGGDLREASLSAQSALQLDGTNVGAVRILAQVSEALKDRSALSWRRKAAEIAPKSLDDILALATCALQFNEIALADKTLRRTEENARGTADYHVTAARLAEAKKEPAAAENHWATAVKLAPGNRSYELQSALALLRMNNPAKRETALPILQRLRSDEKQCAAATRALILDGVEHYGDPGTLTTLARELQSYPGAPFSDRILYLDILWQLHDSKFSGYLTNIEKEASATPADLGSLLSWMTAHGMSILAIDFAHTLPDQELRKWPVPLAMAEADAKLADWTALEGRLRSSNWGQFDFLRRAYVSLALRKQDKPVAAEHEWVSAEKEASSQAQYLSMLAHVASDWGWQKETLELLWMLTKYSDTQFEALEALYQRYTETLDTAGLHRVLVRLADLTPEDARVQNNFAQISLLLNVDVRRARKLAAEAYRKEGSNPGYASTYAFALYTNGDSKGALKIMNGLSENQLRDPALAAYYGVFLAAAGDTARAQEYLSLGASAKLLPEENALVARARSSLK